MHASIEGNVITPLVQRRAVDLPPVLTLFAIVASGGLFGFLGLLLATPLTVIGFIAVKQLYLRDTLQQNTTIRGKALPTSGRLRVIISWVLHSSSLLITLTFGVAFVDMSASAIATSALNWLFLCGIRLMLGSYSGSPYGRDK